MAFDEVASRTAAPIGEIGRAWMLSPSVTAHGATLGLSPDAPFDFWINGRAGVLGEVNAVLATAAIGFVSPKVVTEHWDSRPPTLSATHAALAYRDAAAAWGRDALADIPEADCSEITALCIKVASLPPHSIGLLFAGWRQLELPSDPRGAATIALNLLRELRGAAHLHAVYASGLTPVSAIISVDHPTYGGPARAQRFGWDEPFPEPDFDARGQAEDLTSEIMAVFFRSAFSEAEGQRFIELVDAVRGAIEA